MKSDLTNRKFGRLKVTGSTDKRIKDGSIVWECICDCGKQVFVSSYKLTSFRKISCGCLIKETQRKRVDELRKNNMVEGTDLGSIRNKTIYSTNKSGIRGVHWHGRKKKWAANITFQKKTYYLGYFDDIKDAEKARKEAESRIYDDFLDWYDKHNSK